MAIEIAEFPMKHMVIFHLYANVRGFFKKPSESQEKTPMSSPRDDTWPAMASHGRPERDFTRGEGEF